MSTFQAEKAWERVIGWALQHCIIFSNYFLQLHVNSLKREMKIWTSRTSGTSRSFHQDPGGREIRHLIFTAPYCVPVSLKSSGFPKSAENARGLGLSEIFLCNTEVWQRDLLLFFFHSLVKCPPLCVGRIYDFLLTNRFWQRWWAITVAITQHYNTMHAIISLELFLMSILQFWIFLHFQGMSYKKKYLII